MKTIDKALDLLLEIGRKPLTIAEAAEFLGLHYSSASRVLGTLRDKGFVTLARDHRYEIGPALIRLAARSSVSEDLIGAAHPILQQLSEAISETVHLGVLSDLQTVFIDKIDSTRMIRMHSYIGLSLPLHETAIGKVLLAFQPAQAQQEMLTEILSHPHTIADIDQFRQEIAAAAKEGIGYSWGLHDRHINSLAAPIFGHDGKAVASISISAPVIYTDREKLLGYRPLLLASARGISARLGCPGTRYDNFKPA